MSRRKFSILTALALATTMLIVPGAAAADPVGECPSGDWALIDADDPSVADKAASKDAKGNGDGSVCFKLNKKGKLSIKDNIGAPSGPPDPPPAPGPGPSECPSEDWDLVAADDPSLAPSLADKAASKDAKGNGDDFVCVKENKKGKLSIKDNK